MSSYRHPPPPVTSDDKATVGMLVTIMSSYPYLSNRLHWFPRSTGHNVALAAILAVVWGTAFCWDKIERRFPRYCQAVSIAGQALAVGFVAGLFGLAYYLIFTT